MPNEIPIGVSIEGAQQAEQRLDQLYSTASRGLEDLVGQTGEFSEDWQETWRRQPDAGTYVNFTREAGRNLQQLQSRADEVLDSLKALSEEGADTSNIEKRTQKLRAHLQTLETLRRTQETGAEAISEGAEAPEDIYRGVGFESGIKATSRLVKGLATSADKMFEQREAERAVPEETGREGEAAAPIGPLDQPIIQPQARPTPGAGLLDQFGRPIGPPPEEAHGPGGVDQNMGQLNEAFAALLDTVGKLNERMAQSETAEGRRGRRKRREDDDEQGRRRPGGPGVIQEAFARYGAPMLPSGMMGGRFARGLSSRLAQGAAGGAGGAGAVGGFGGAAGLAGMMGPAVAAAVPLILAGVAVKGYGKARDMARESEGELLDLESLTRRVGGGREEGMGLAEAFMPEGRTRDVQRRMARFGFSPQEQIKAMGQVEAPGLLQGGAEQIRDFSTMTQRFAREQGQELPDVTRMLSDMAVQGVQPDAMSGMLEGLSDSLEAGVDAGIGKNRTLRQIRELSEQSVSRLGAIDESNVRNAAVMVNAFQQAGPNFRGPGGEAMRQGLLGGLEGGVNDPQRFAMFSRAVRQRAAEAGEDPKSYMEQMYQVVEKDPALQERFAKLQSVKQSQLLMESISNNPTLAGEILPLLFGGEGADPNIQQVMGEVMFPGLGKNQVFMAGAGIGDLAGGMREGGAQAGMTPQQRMMAAQGDMGELPTTTDQYGFQRIDTERLNEAQREMMLKGGLGLKEGRFKEGQRLAPGEEYVEPGVETVIPLADAIRQANAETAAAQLAVSTAMSAATVDTAIHVAAIRNSMAGFVQDIVNALGGKGFKETEAVTQVTTGGGGGATANPLAMSHVRGDDETRNLNSKAIQPMNNAGNKSHNRANRP